MGNRQRLTKADLSARAMLSPRPTGPLNAVARAAAKRKICRLLAKHGIINIACIGAGITRRTFYLWMESDPDFNAAATEAIERSVDVLEIEARRRAERGTRRPVYQQGKLVGHTREYSDKLMELLLKAKRPEQYAQKTEINSYSQTNVQVNQAGADGAPQPVISPERQRELEWLQRIAAGQPVEGT